jgi:hypothetical protein
MNKQDAIIATGIFLAILSVLHVGSTDYRTANEEKNMYCSMVGIYKSSDGQYGWPPYQGEEMCDE